MKSILFAVGCTSPMGEIKIDPNTPQDYERFRRLEQNRSLPEQKLPAVSQFLRVCVEAEETTTCAGKRNEYRELITLGRTILQRAERTLQALGYIGTIFHDAPDKDIADEMTYHFDYLTLLLSGIFDIQARIARMVYRIERPRERNASFRRNDFTTALRDAGATDLHRVVTSASFHDISRIVSSFRTCVPWSIAEMMRIGSATMNPSQPNHFVLALQGNHGDIEIAISRQGGLDHWGMFRESGILCVEPYAFATRSVFECLCLVNQIAEAINTSDSFF